MPLVQISLRCGTTPDYRRAIADGIHEAMMEALGIPADDRFQLILEHPPENMIHGRTFFGVERSDRSVFIQIVINYRDLAQKRKLYELVPRNLNRNPGLRTEDVFIGVIEVSPENWWAFARPASGNLSATQPGK